MEQLEWIEKESANPVWIGRSKGMQYYMVRYVEHKKKYLVASFIYTDSMLEKWSDSVEDAMRVAELDYNSLKD